MAEVQSTEAQGSGSIPTVEQVTSRKTTMAKGYTFVSALLAKDSPVAKFLPIIRTAKFSSEVSEQFGDQDVNEVMNVLATVTGNTPDTYKAKETTLGSGEEIVDPELKAYMAGQLEEGIALLEQHGYLPSDLRAVIGSRLLIPSELRLVTGDFSDFTYRNILLPEKPIQLNISPAHVEFNTNRVKGFIEDAGLADRFTHEEIKELGVKTALIHEYGHAMDTGLLILLAAKVIGSKPPYPELDTRRLDPQTDKKIWDAIVERFNHLYPLTAGDREKKVAGFIDKADMHETYIEGIAVGAELALLDTVFKDKGFTPDEQQKVFTVIDEYFSKRTEDYAYFAEIIKKQGLDMFKSYPRFDYAVTSACKEKGYNISNFIPSFPSGKIAGYTLPLTPDALKTYVTNFVPPDYS